MTITETIIAITIHLIIPLIGVIYFFILRNRMINKNIPEPPILELFFIFVTYGGLILVALTTLFWQWSGMASLGTFYLFLGAPFVMGIVAYRHRETKSLSKYHLWTYYLGLLYIPAASAVFIVGIIVNGIIKSLSCFCEAACPC